MGLLESIRRWIDGEQGEDLLEAADEHSKPRRIWEEFLVKIAREVEAVMQREMFTPPGGLTYIPREYVVYLSNEDDKDWQGDKRRGLEQGLFHVLSERARELSGSNQLAAKSFAVELRVDGTLEKGQFRVQAVWDETESGHTQVNARVGATPKTAPPPSVNLSDTVREFADGSRGDTEGGDAEGQSEQGEATVVRPRIKELYSVEIWKDGVREAVVPVTKPEITIGRGSRSITVDLPLKGDPEISRVHATLTRENDGRYYLLAKGRNATMVGPRELPRGERTEVMPHQKIAICNFVLRIQPR
ncbi:MAG TPA: FhaA domain-containing protein, partial [Pyrinomonadaceae bacterium]|nr:FhaA domain-containing protein [Pyrinomonadaceae bacterium]